MCYKSESNRYPVPLGYPLKELIPLLFSFFGHRTNFKYIIESNTE